MQTKITFAGGDRRSTAVARDVRPREHAPVVRRQRLRGVVQPDVLEGGLRATSASTYATARTAATAAGGLGTPAGDAAFETSLINRFNTNYNTTSATFWTVAPSNPTVGNLFATANTYTRPGTAYLALWRDPRQGQDDRDDEARSRPTYGGGSITEPQLEAEFHQSLPNQTRGLPRAARPVLHAVVRHRRTRRAAARTSRRSPGPAWPAPASSARRRSPTPSPPRRRPATNGWYTGNVTIAWNVDNGLDPTTTHDRLRRTRPSRPTARSPSRARPRTRSAPPGPVTVTVKRDATAPATTATLDADRDRRLVLATNGHADSADRPDVGRRVDELPPRRRAVDAVHGPVLRRDVRAAHARLPLDRRGRERRGDQDRELGLELPGLGADSRACPAFVTSLGLDKGLHQGAAGPPRRRGAASSASRKEACKRARASSLKDVIDGAGKPKPKLTFAQAHQLLSVNQIEALLGCIPAGSGAPDGRARHAHVDADGRQLRASGSGRQRPQRTRPARSASSIAGDEKNDNACHGLDELSKKIADRRRRTSSRQRRPRRSTPVVAEISRAIGCCSAHRRAASPRPPGRALPHTTRRFSRYAASRVSGNEITKKSTATAPKISNAWISPRPIGG